MTVHTRGFTARFLSADKDKVRKNPSLLLDPCNLQRQIIERSLPECPATNINNEDRFARAGNVSGVRGGFGGQPGQSRHQSAHTAQALLIVGPVALVDQLVVGPQFYGADLTGDEFDQRAGIGERVVAKTDDGAFRAGIEFLDTGVAAELFQRHHL